MILFLADAFDVHADAVERELVAKGAEFFRLNLDVTSLKESIIHFDGIVWRVAVGNKNFSSENVRVVWARRLTVNLDLDQEISYNDTGFQIWRSEWNKALYGLYVQMRELYWINPIQNSNLVENKFYQSKIATKNNLKFPSYVTSNDKKTLIDFANQYGDVALKFMSQEMYKDSDGNVTGLYVNKIKTKDLGDFNIHGENPITLQSYIVKKFEVRYTYINDTHLACKIHSQLSVVSNIDWRRYDIANTPHEPMNIPDLIKNKVRNFMSEVGLIYGAFDFIVDENDDWWFLEVNANGQWLWVEDLAGLPISATIASVLFQRDGMAV